MFQDTIKSLRNKDNKTISKCISLVENKEKKETFLFYSFITGTLLVFMISIMAIAPSI